ncbi:YiaA/B family two helix domain-containing protein [Hydromonas duriensis]|uniref:YiaA/B family two helix domain-containing protein n=1 Tax=Hydromonas duriensis TaxID=1527608 RepID=A0A4R6Y9V0_9BURK|nr:YiaA/B family two helix domain-containing protein [Hydromonas duriensis]
MYGLFSAISLQKSIRDKEENIPVPSVYYSLAWLSLVLSVLLLVARLLNTNMLQSEKRFYGISLSWRYLLRLPCKRTPETNTICKVTVVLKPPRHAPQ